MKKCLSVILLILPALFLNGQQIYIRTGSAISVFDYRNSDGERLDNLHGGNHFFLQTGYRTVSAYNRFNYSAGLTYTGYVSRGSDMSLGNYYEWDANYLGIDLGIDYELIKKRYTTNAISDLTVYLKLTASPEILVNGTQTINKQVYSLMGTEQFKYPFFFVRGGAGVSYSINRLISVYAEYLAGYGLPVKIGDRNDKEKLRFINQNIGIGVLINLPGFKTWM
jgi:hypothetical protein